MTFAEVLNEAVADVARTGFVSEIQVAEWMRKLRAAALGEMLDDNEVRRQVRAAFEAQFNRQLRTGIAELNPGVGRFTVARLEPQMRAELDRRIMASAALIKLNKTEAVEKTLRRFQGWSTSIPKGGSAVVDKREVKAHIAKPTKQQRYECRRVTIDQGHKLVAAISEIVANNSGAIAGLWRSHWRRPGYQYREDHKERDKVVYAVRGNWAMQAGLMKKGAGYTDEIERPAELPYCSCYYRWITDLADLPPEMITEKGRAYLAKGMAA